MYGLLPYDSNRSYDQAMQGMQGASATLGRIQQGHKIQEEQQKTPLGAIQTGAAGAAAGVKIGAALGSSGGPVGAVVGGIVGLLGYFFS